MQVFRKFEDVFLFTISLHPGLKRATEQNKTGTGLYNYCVFVELGYCFFSTSSSTLSGEPGQILGLDSQIDDFTT